MIRFFKTSSETIYALDIQDEFSAQDLERLTWLFGGATTVDNKTIEGEYIGPRATMITPWSTNAVEITRNMGIGGILRIEQFIPASKLNDYDPMLLQSYPKLHQKIFTIPVEPEPVRNIDDIAAYNLEEGLSLSEEEVEYLYELSKKLGRPLTDSEVFGFSQVNSEHCRHKIFNGTFVIDGEEMPQSLFAMIKATSKANPNDIVSAYKDNVAFLKGPTLQQFAPEKADTPSLYETKDFESVLSIKAETHNFPTTVEPFNGAATGSGGEIRDRMAGGRGSVPLAGTAVYMTSYSRLKNNRSWENATPERPWLYRTPIDILISASNGASDFGNKFGQPLINGSLLTFEHQEGEEIIGYDKVIMLAGGIGYGKSIHAQKNTPEKGDVIVIMGGDNYRIGMGGAAVSSADTGAMDAGLELNAVQRSNPEMQKRVANAIRAMVESADNPIVSIHDHGAGGHLNCLSELVEETGGRIDLHALPIGDPTLSDKEIIGNESQERMGLVIKAEDFERLERVAKRERAPIYKVGEISGDHQFVFENKKTKKNPIDLHINHMFGSSPKTIIQDETKSRNFRPIAYNQALLHEYLHQVLKLEAVACKDWLTNKVDRCVGGLVAVQQCVGPLQLPLNNLGVSALEFSGTHGLATALGHAPVSGLIDAAKGVRNAIAEALSNLVWAPLEDGIRSVSLSANWMWPCKNEGEDARLYQAVQTASEFAIELGINIPTGKDSLSMAQKYPDQTVLAPGTVVITAAGHCPDHTKVITPLARAHGEGLYYINLSGMPQILGGSSFAQIRNQVGADAPGIADAEGFKKAFNAIQAAIKEDLILAGHDVSSGGLITTLLEMCFADNQLGMSLDLTGLGDDLIKILFSENAGIVVQAKSERLPEFLKEKEIDFHRIGEAVGVSTVMIRHGQQTETLDVGHLRDIWYETSYLLDAKQTANNLAEERYKNFKKQPLHYSFPEHHTGQLPNIITELSRPKAAILREKGSNSSREMANALYRSGFEVLDVHMTDLIEGREDLKNIQFLGAVGGFSNSDVLGSAKGWAGAIKYNERANEAISNFFKRPDTLSIGICNGCQLFLELDLINPDHEHLSKMTFNDSHKHESAFTSVHIEDNKSIMLSNLSGATLGVWISHGEGKFALPMPESAYHICAKYAYSKYPANPNGSDYNVAMLCSPDGRHLATMPHIERSFFAWNWPYYLEDRRDHSSPWALAFRNAFEFFR